MLRHSSYDVEDSIAAIATACGGSLRGVIRLSGPHCGRCLAECFRPGPGTSSLSSLRRATTLSGRLLLGEPIGSIAVEVLYWPTPRSFTGQQAAEIHCIGSPPVMQAILRKLCQHGARPAEPGEFSLRAFLAGRIDLTQAEAVLGIVHAESDRQLEVALRQFAGGIATRMHQLREQMLQLLADVEAGLDFVDEDIEFVSQSELARQLDTCQQTVLRLVEQIAQREIPAGEFRVVLAGWPNVGKSSLFNALLGRQAAVVSDLPGTTRDYVSARLAIDGMNLTLVDTAGRQADHGREPVQQFAQLATGDQLRSASLQLLCLDASRQLNEWESQQLAASPPNRLVVLTKCDRNVVLQPAADWLETSAISGAGLDQLRQQLAAANRQPGENPHLVPQTAARCATTLHRADQALGRAIRNCCRGIGEELVAAELREAIDQVGLVVGAVYTGDLLDRIFSRFCIGK